MGWWARELLLQREKKSSLTDAFKEDGFCTARLGTLGRDTSNGTSLCLWPVVGRLDSLESERTIAMDAHSVTFEIVRSGEASVAIRLRALEGLGSSRIVGHLVNEKGARSDTRQERKTI